MSERSAVTTVLVAEALAHGDMGLAAAMLAPAAVRDRASRCGATPTSRRRYLPAFTGEDVARRARWRCSSRGRCSTRSRSRRRARARTATATASTAPSRSSRAPPTAELFVVGAQSSRARARRCSSSRPAPSGADHRARARDGRARRGHRPAGARQRRGRRARCSAAATPRCTPRRMQRARLAWCALAVGTGQAVLDYVIPYVNERQAFGEPISHRQAVAFTVSDIAIELDGMRLATCRAAARADQGKDVRARGGARAPAVRASKGMAIGSDGVQLLGGHGYVKEYPVERWYRDLRAAGVMEGAAAGLMINLEIPKKFRPLVEQAHQVADGGLPADLAQVRPRRARVPEGARHARRADRRAWRRAAAPAAPARRASAAADRTRTATAATATARTCRPCSASWSCAGATSACCCRCRARGSATPRSPRSPTTSSSSASSGKWAAMAITEPEAGSDSAAIRTTAVLDGDEYVLNGEKIYVTSGERADARRGLGDARPRRGPRRDQVVRRRALEPRAEARPPRAQARHPRVGHRRVLGSRTAACRRRTCSAAPRSTRRRASPARCRRSTTPARSSPRWRSGSPRRASTRPASG